MITITIKEEQDSVHISVVGKLDGLSSAEFEKAVIPLAGSGRALVIDCSELLYISSAGMRSILMAARKAQAPGSSFSLSGLSGAARESVIYSGFASLLRLDD